MRQLIRLAVAVLGVVVVLACVLVVRTLLFTSGVATTVVPRDTTAVDSAVVRRLSEAIRIPTVTRFDAPADMPQILKFHAFLAKSFPRVYAAMRREVVDSGTLLFTWRGTDTTLAPVLLMGHMDVVPVEPGTEKDWKHPPFDGVVAEGSVWGRGSLDDKVSVMGLMEGVSALIAGGFKPRRTLILEFGHTEEGGSAGGAARKAAQLLKSRGVSPWFVMDEGGAVGDGLVPGVQGLVGVVGVAEKGYLSLKLTARAEGGHSSMPARETSVSILADAVRKVQATRLPARLDGATRAMLEALAPSLPFVPRVIMTNLSITGPLVVRLLAGDHTGNAMVRTTTAATMISGGIKDNVIPASANAIVNFRLLPGDSVAWVMRRVTEIVHDARVSVEQVAGAGVEASRVSPDTSQGFRLIASAARSALGAGVVVPYLVVAGTDSRHFELVSPNVYRFAPIVADKSTMGLIHSTNERIAVDNYFSAVRFYRSLLESSLR